MYFKNDGPDHTEFRIKVDNTKKITGDIKTKSSMLKISGGSNPFPGTLEIELANGDRVTYRFFRCNRQFSLIYRKPACLNESWHAINSANANLKRLVPCFEPIDCPLYNKGSDDFESFEHAVFWSRKSDILPFSNEIYEKGSPISLSVYKLGTFFNSAQRPKEPSLRAAEVEHVKDIVVKTLEATGVQVSNFEPGSRGPTDFVFTITGRSPKLGFPDGYWFQSKIQFAAFRRREPDIGDGVVEQVELNVLGTKIFKGPSSYTPQANQFQSVSLVDKKLVDYAVDAALNLSIVDLYTSKFSGVIAQQPEGL
ncbi:hypothetical protein [Methylobacterium radiotolerans]|uniref:hypothetical protein n=1 Tax=Methylobacterium radiotolerans TaxID=31998 RepID=UPI000D5D504C|nr:MULTISPECIES: hypothetical protein [Methylobacterium]MDE3747368.1 hypothetical protein [Methylobacterium radiotolerans]PVY96985.1 hypothetical protein C7388_11663 [Methylobacterium organophilum]